MDGRHATVLAARSMGHATDARSRFYAAMILVAEP
jgi:hypothetical protein